MATSLKNLQQILEFDDADLKANQCGKLSKKQVESLQIQAHQELKAMLIIPALVVIWILLSLELLLALPAVLLISALIAGLVVLHKEQAKRIRDEKVEKLSGMLKKQPSQARFMAPQCLITIADHELAIEPEIYEQLTEAASPLC